MKIFSYFNESYFEYMKSKEKDSTLILDEVFKNLKNSYEFLYEIVMKLNPKIEEKTESFKTQLDSAYKLSLSNNNNNTNAELVQKLQTEMNQLIKQYDEEKELLQDKIDKLEKENKIITEKLIKNAKGLTTKEAINRRYSTYSILISL